MKIGDISSMLIIFSSQWIPTIVISMPLLMIYRLKYKITIHVWDYMTFFLGSFLWNFFYDVDFLNISSSKSMSNVIMEFLVIGTLTGVSNNICYLLKKKHPEKAKMISFYFFILTFFIALGVYSLCPELQD